jgi:hypothetical protein
MCDVMIAEARIGVLFSMRTLVLPCHYHSTIAPCSSVTAHEVHMTSLACQHIVVTSLFSCDFVCDLREVNV